MTSIVDLTNTPTIFTNLSSNNNHIENKEKINSSVQINISSLEDDTLTENDEKENSIYRTSNEQLKNIKLFDRKKINTGNIIKSLRNSLIESKKYNSNFIPESNTSSIDSYIKNTSEYEIWTNEMEDEILNLSEICIEDSNDINNKANFYIKYGKIIQVSLIIIGVSSVYISSSSVPDIIKNNINIVLGASSAIISSIYSLFSFSKKGIKLKEISYDLSNLSRIIRCELFKPTLKRDNITNFLIFIQTTRDKLLKKVDIE